MFGRRKKATPAVAVTRSWTYRYAGLEFTISATTASEALEELRAETSARAAREAQLIEVR